MDNIILAAVGVAIVFTIFFYFCNKNHEPYENLRIIRVNKKLYSEPNLNCDMGAKTCRLSTGPMGTCDVLTRECVEIPNSAPQKMYKDVSMAPPIGERSEECQWRGICTRKDNGMGVCMSGLCYPATHIAS